MTTGNCANTPKNVFFPPHPGGRGQSHTYNTAVHYAQTICEGCPQQLPCYKGAIERGETMGIWGGVNFRGHTSAGCGTESAYRAHLRNGEIACDPCRIAVYEANQRRLLNRQQHEDLA